MRDIKFRAWDEQNKFMHNEVDFIRSGTDANDWILFKSDKQKLEQGNVLDNPYFQQQIKVMQYTGLNDKNGIEVYEGDIVKFIPSGEYGKVTTFGKSQNLGIEWENSKTAFFTPMFYLGCESELEVIGNLYENPELIEDIK